MKTFTFVDLFCGVGGFRIALEALGGACVWANDNDKFVAQTYKAWHDGPFIMGDLRDLQSHVPSHDVLTAGFPRQPFSQSKASGNGSLLTEVMRIIGRHSPKAVIIENVPSAGGSDSAFFVEIINESLVNMDYRGINIVVDSRPWVPQRRRRRFFAYLRADVFRPYAMEALQRPQEGLENGPRLDSILEHDFDPKYRLSDRLWAWHQAHRATMNQRHGYTNPKSGFGYSIASPDGVSNTLSARYGKDGSEILIELGDGGNPRKLTPREAARLMGYPDHLPIVVSDTQFYRQMGNSVVPQTACYVATPLIQAILDTSLIPEAEASIGDLSELFS